MKKIFFAATLFVAAIFASCGNKTNQAAEGATDSVAGVDTTAQTAEGDNADEIINTLNSSIGNKDSKAFETAVADVKKKYDELVKAGLTEEAEAYAAKFKEYFAKHADEVKTVAAGNATINEIINNVKTLPTSAEEVAGKVKEDAKKAVTEGKEAVKKDIENRKQEAKEKKDKAVNDAAEKAGNAVSGAINKVLGGR